jgi:alkylhydroperoxidase/carboxymuconolactone decarboxylase family protein YurZ
MTTSRPGGWQAMLEKGAPEILKQVSGIQQMILADGALSAKTKTLMMVLGDSLLNHSEGVNHLANRARSLGASEAEIQETIAMAFLMGGLPGVVTGANAFKG